MKNLKDWNKILNGRFIANPSVGTYLSIADNKGASIECTVLSQNGEVWQIGEQHLPRPALPGWRAPQNLGGKGVIAEPVNTWGSAHGLGTDNHLYRHENGRWQIHDNVAQFPKNAIHRSGRLGRGIKNRVWLSDYENNWQDVGGEIQGRPDWVEDNLIVALGSDTAIWVREIMTRAMSPQPLFGEWTSLKGEFIGNPIALTLPFQRIPPDGSSLKTSRIMVIARGTPDNRLWMREWTEPGRWGKWVDLGGDCQGSPSVAQIDGSNDFYCFVRGGDSRLKCLPYENGRWGDWQDWGGEILSDPAAASLWNDGRQGARIRVFALGTDAALWERTMTVSN